MAAVNWQEILGWTPEQVSELRFAGFSFLREGKYELALVFFEGLVILDPKNAYDIETLGALYLQLNENEKALETLDTALAIDPTHALSQLNKVKALIALNRKNEAMPLAQPLTTNPDVTIADDAQALIAAYGVVA